MGNASGNRTIAYCLLNNSKVSLRQMEDRDATERTAARILYIEDEPGAARHVQKHLSRKGYEVDLAEDGEQGIEILALKQHDVLLLDQRMPGMHGIDVIRKLVEQNALPITIMVTGAGDEATAVEAIKLGASDYLVKETSPAYLDRIPTTIEKALRNRQFERDIAQQQEELRASEARLRDLFENTSDFIVTLDENGRYVFVNRSWIDTFGYSLTEARTLNIVDHVQDDDRPLLTGYLDALRRGEQGDGIRLRVRTRDGRTVIVEGNAIARHGTTNGTEIRGIFHDITAHIESAQTIKRYSDELEHRNLELAAFNHTVAHDLSNLIQAVMSYAQTLNRMDLAADSATALEFANQIYVASKQMDRVVNSLLLLSQLRDTTGLLEVFPVDGAVASALSRVEAARQARGVQISVESPLPPALVYLPWVEEVFFNLLSNAIKYTGVSNPSPTVTVSGSWADGQATFFVEDNGIGIEPDDHARVFDLHSRFHKTEAKGSGLGLSIVKRIVERMGGEVGLNSAPGEGSTFWFRLPSTERPPR